MSGHDDEQNMAHGTPADTFKWGDIRIGIIGADAIEFYVWRGGKAKPETHSFEELGLSEAPKTLLTLRTLLLGSGRFDPSRGEQRYRVGRRKGDDDVEDDDTEDDVEEPSKRTAFDMAMPVLDERRAAKNAKGRLEQYVSRLNDKLCPLFEADRTERGNLPFFSNGGSIQTRFEVVPPIDVVKAVMPDNTDISLGITQDIFMPKYRS